MANIEETLKRLAVTFVVRDIMTPRESLVCADDGAEPAMVSDSNPNFSVIPIRQQGKLTCYFERGTRCTKDITLSDLISDGTSLFDLVEFMAEREFAFVLSRRDVEGYIHYSDLNHDLVKLAFYVILEAVERLALESLPPEKGSEAYLERMLPDLRFNQIKSLYKRSGDAARSLLNYLNIADILRLAVAEGLIQLDERAITDMKQTRDGAAHVLENLVADYGDVQKLANIRRECLRILGASVGREKTFRAGV